MNQEKAFAHEPGESLALVDVETYPVFIDKKADRLDMMAHFSNQMQALTILSWKAPARTRHFRLLLTENDHLVDRIARSSPAQIASGNLRTYGQICLATHEQLFDCARHRTHDLFHRAPRSKIARPRLLDVSPGVYSITLYYHAPSLASGEKSEVDYTVVLRHYPFPPPRVAPVRLHAGFLPPVGEEVASRAWAAITSHKAPGVGLSKVSR